MSSFDRLAPAQPAVGGPPLSTLRGRRYGEDRLYLLVRDPRSVLAVWELTAGLHARAQGIARDHKSPLRYQIRIERREEERAPGAVLTSVELPDALGGERVGHWLLGKVVELGSRREQHRGAGRNSQRIVDVVGPSDVTPVAGLAVVAL